MCIEQTLLSDGRVRTAEATDLGAGIPGVKIQSRETKDCSMRGFTEESGSLQKVVEVDMVEENRKLPHRRYEITESLLANGEQPETFWWNFGEHSRARLVQAEYEPTNFGREKRLLKADLNIQAFDGIAGTLENGSGIFYAYGKSTSSAVCACMVKEGRTMGVMAMSITILEHLPGRISIGASSVIVVFWCICEAYERSENPLPTDGEPQNWGREMNECSECPTPSQDARSSSKKSDY
ncbi:hypothetical protein FB451DRAFT_1370893 [Mycena latifolia]|nr:hypothetical protein FB451DRAFT_1370893 [Mycena latifolia]